MSGIDDLFELPAPAALKRGMNRGKWPYKHGNFVAWTGWFGCGTCRVVFSYLDMCLDSPAQRNRCIAK